MTDLLELSSKIIDENITDRQINRINFQLSELTEDIAMVEAFSHSIVFKTSEGLLVIDTSNEGGGKQVVEAIRGWSKDPFNTLIYTHGHLDHVGGSSSFLA
ncbi:MAG: MBL fold metallo-hydrolase, partial [Deltaproteobacteria bacterium]|nr:MBL fold metallo-hydrolase [Deltaproteobacteria bacterium]